VTNKVDPADRPADDRPVHGGTPRMKSQSKSKCFGKCRSCGATFSATIRPDGTLKPIGIAPDCTCGDADFYRLLGGGGA
jgi:hypothetical protein